MNEAFLKRYTTTKKFLAGVCVPPVPDTVFKLRILLGSRFINLTDVVELLESNSVIAGEFIGAISSGRFLPKPPYEITSMHEALDLVGINNPLLIEIITMIEMKHAFLGNPGHQEEMSEVLDYCSDVAYLCSEISEYVHGADKAEAYLFGLFADCGYLYLLLKQHKFIKVFRNSLTNPLNALKTEISFGADHACAGYLIAREWNLPMWVKAGILFHHGGGEGVSTSVGKDTRDIISIYTVASYIVNEVTYGGYITQEFKDLMKHNVEELGLTTEDVSSIRRTFIVDNARK